MCCASMQAGQAPHLLLEGLRFLASLFLHGGRCWAGLSRQEGRAGRAGGGGGGGGGDARRGPTAASRFAGESQFGLASIEITESNIDCRARSGGGRTVRPGQAHGDGAAEGKRDGVACVA